MDFYMLIIGYWILGSAVVAISTVETRMGWIGGLLLSIFLSPPVGAICAFAGGMQRDDQFQDAVNANLKALRKQLAQEHYEEPGASIRKQPTSAN